MPIHAFSLVVPHLVALLEASSLEAEEGNAFGRSRIGDCNAAGRTHAPTASSAATAGQTGAAGATLRQDEGDGSNSRRQARGQWREAQRVSTTTAAATAPATTAEPVSPLTTTAESTAVTATVHSNEPSLSTEQERSQPPELAEVKAAAEAGVETETEEAQAPEAEAGALEAEESQAAKDVAAAWVLVFDLTAARLGPSLAAEVLLPSVLATLEG